MATVGLTPETINQYQWQVADGVAKAIFTDIQKTIGGLKCTFFGLLIMVSMPNLSFLANKIESPTPLMVSIVVKRLN
jgi:hypothetical protein